MRLSSYYSYTGAALEEGRAAMVTRFLQSRVDKGLRPATLRCYEDRLSCLSLWAKYLKKDISQLTEKDVREYLSGLRVSPVTIQGRIVVWRTFYRWGLRQGLISHNPVEGIETPRVDLPFKETIAPVQLELLLDNCELSFYGRRDRAIMMTLYDTGLRLSEMTSLETPDVAVEERYIVIRQSKNRTYRLVPTGERVTKELNRYIRDWRRPLPGSGLFCDREGRHMTGSHLRRQVSRRGEKLGMRISPHLFRHSFATEYLRAGGDRIMLQRILGHKTGAMTERYTHYVIEDLITAHKNFSPVDRMAG
jgi:integrase/recombinase XerD